MIYGKYFGDGLSSFVQEALAETMPLKQRRTARLLGKRTSGRPLAPSKSRLKPMTLKEQLLSKIVGGTNSQKLGGSSTATGALPNPSSGSARPGPLGPGEQAIFPDYQLPLQGAQGGDTFVPDYQLILRELFGG